MYLQEYRLQISELFTLTSLSLSIACHFNHDMLMHFHPGAYTKTGWSCCHQRHKPTLGCQPTYYLLTRSSSRYAEMRRAQRISRRSNTRPYSTPHRSSDLCEKESELPPKTEIRSTSCDNLHTVDHMFPSLSHLADTPTVSSCYTLTAVSDVTSLSTDGHVTPMESHLTLTKRCSFQDEKSSLSDKIPLGTRSKASSSFGSIVSPRHQVAPLPLTPLLVTHKHRLGSVDSGTEATPPPSAKKQLYVGGSQSSSVSGDPLFEYHSWPRKASIEPRISNTDPEVLHVQSMGQPLLINNQMA